MASEPLLLSRIPNFDPGGMIHGRDEHLAAVPSERLTPDALRQRFQAPPVWLPEFEREPRRNGRSPVDAAVLIPLVVRDELTVLLTYRSTHLSSHAGQVAFPGGKVDAGDASPAGTALREAQEEVGLAPDFVEVLGTMPPFMTGTGYVITAVPALVQPGFTLEPNPHEVTEVFETPLRFLMDPAQHRRHRIEHDGQHREWVSMLYAEPGKEHLIWGATAAMLRNLYRFLSA